ncbi:putative tannase/feruloyl esterase [Variovorax paradoxus B4]|uniref:Putative tannase/feruloyl esterase n=1 Tax=Variovorax paradoxus B4 TaxID=1246301 RepID=T1XA65_VARPD|nr:putative tannase/feruloyl esterase [Variovorax paradoxus B4]
MHGQSSMRAFSASPNTRSVRRTELTPMYTVWPAFTPFTLIAVAAALTACSQPPVAKAGACESLTAFGNVPNVTVDKAEMMLPGFVPPGEKRAVTLPFCRVQATARPSSDSDIKFEMWLPDASNWNGRFLANGGGGNSGAIIYSRLTEGLTRGYASLSTDNGHASKGGNLHEQSWAVGHPQKVIDFGYRAQTVTAVAGKQITRAFYGSPASKSYWIGCSQGGGKGLMQAQRYPENFDGIVAGSPVFDWTGSMFSPAWVTRKGYARSGARRPASQAAHDPQGSAGRMRRAGRSGRWAAAGAWKVQIRPGDDRMFSWKERRYVSDARRSGGHEAILGADHRQRRPACLSRLAIRRRAHL